MLLLINRHSRMLCSLYQAISQNVLGGMHQRTNPTGSVPIGKLLARGLSAICMYFPFPLNMCPELYSPT